MWAEVSRFRCVNILNKFVLLSKFLCEECLWKISKLGNYYTCSKRRIFKRISFFYFLWFYEEIVDENNMKNIIFYFSKNLPKKGMWFVIFSVKPYYTNGQHLQRNGQRNDTVIISHALIITSKPKTSTTLRFLWNILFLNNLSYKILLNKTDNGDWYERGLLKS